MRTPKNLRDDSMDINVRLDLEAQHDARALQDTELLRRDLNATFNDADRGVPLHHYSTEQQPAPSKACVECGASIHPGVLRKRPDATLCYECYGKRRHPMKV